MPFVNTITTFSAFCSIVHSPLDETNGEPTDDRLMSMITLTDELEAAFRVFGLSLHDLEKLTINAMKSAFIPYKQRITLIYDVLKPGFKKARAKLAKKT